MGAALAGSAAGTLCAVFSVGTGGLAVPVCGILVVGTGSLTGAKLGEMAGGSIGELIYEASNDEL